ncbi:inorganic polyphosphate kinase [Marinitoga sp. 1135]|uniref:NAD kinase n=1 Tax=Marinitoga piezophila (strain DSM 14283 / JCM 11233 / KA3) TaxID=443254 RepID=H2J7M0_MARPK|nr:MULTISPECIES: NAD(+)/NADH kinase [Marinitoga]AEX85361.1 putative sugar kinase [Marinitoga piezophila KA3]APT75839.1 inorganic polyphosphate kinase [Marinitoga sp. 1137]NUU95625.1 inorganic polyphosphate kinase [Marinitoga sp. 1135]NUU97496.1 inorganic polyphosphate kinase [Marinitoga sp. 1138]
MKGILFFNPIKAKKQEIIDNYLHVFEENDIEILKVMPAGSALPDNTLYQESDVFIVLGGDGTVLRVAELSAEYSVPIVGINLGTLGFLTAYDSTEMEQAAKDIASNNLHYSDRFLLECYVGGKKILSLNDITIQKSQPIGTVDLEILIKGESVLNYSGDGVIISTPTGSTGYALSMGGPVIEHSLNLITINPLASHSLNIRPLVISPDNYVEIMIHHIDAGNAYVTVDGDIVHRIESGMAVLVSSSDKKVTLAQKNDYSFFKVLINKLGFGRRLI